MTSDLVYHVLARFGIDPSACRVTPVSGGFSGAVVHRVESPDRSLALRGWPHDDLPPARIRGLHALLAHLFRVGVDVVAVPLTNAGGDSVVRLAERDWQLEPWLPGSARLSKEGAPGLVAAACRSLAEFHTAAESHAADESSREWFGSRPPGPTPAVIERIRRIERWNGGQLKRLRERLVGEHTRFAELGRLVVAGFERSAENVRRDLDRFARERVPLLPCWRDLHGEHVLFEGDRVTGLLDPSACRVENPSVDLSRLLGDVFGDDHSARDAAVEAYADMRRLTVVERDLIGVLDRSAVLLMGLTWLDRCYLKGWSIDSDPRVLARLERVVDRLSRLP